jgi:hypothetical protein
MDICSRVSRLFGETPDAPVRACAGKSGLEYARDDDSMIRPFGAPPLIVSCLYHEEIKKSAKKGGGTHA